MDISLEPELAALRAAWESVRAVEQQHRAAQAHAWQARLAELRAEQDALLRNGAWIRGPYDMLGILGASRREAFHSALLGWLLDPQGRHGLGPAFLDALLRRCMPGPSPVDLHRARPALEVTQFQ